MDFAQRTHEIMKTIVDKNKRVIMKNSKVQIIVLNAGNSSQSKQAPVVQTNIKKVFMKNLFISDLILESEKFTNDERILIFSTNMVEGVFQIRENLHTKEITLYQDNYVLDNNAGVCQILINKLAA